MIDVFGGPPSGAFKTDTSLGIINSGRFGKTAPKAIKCRQIDFKDRPKFVNDQKKAIRVRRIFMHKQFSVSSRRRRFYQAQIVGGGGKLKKLHERTHTVFLVDSGVRVTRPSEVKCVSINPIRQNTTINSNISKTYQFFTTTSSSGVEMSVGSVSSINSRQSVAFFAHQTSAPTSNADAAAF
ncbi:unnamed protein product [Caenorhabditis auriculariae]|uniref:Uncharacterized protein n=1 Tax=Caenorhabditis auriculariae TaxID=2777116 RepID=A0A8S1H4S6_9PELO|nr:unnamed protein product [Caenorhabditis auriculariae]